MKLSYKVLGLLNSIFFQTGGCEVSQNFSFELWTSGLAGTHGGKFQNKNRVIYKIVVLYTILAVSLGKI